MIKYLAINNYALIQSLEIHPSKSLSIITGETGAGKSIMLGALGLLMGNRADTKTLWDEDKKCTVEAVFDIRQYALTEFFETNDLDFDDDCIIRREILPSGKSRAFINDTPVTLPILKELSPFLMDIHSQHDGLLLGAEHYQRSLLDTYAGHTTLLDQYRQAYKSYKSLEAHLEELLAAAQLSTQEEEYKRYVLNELEEVDLDNLNIAVLEEELNTLENAEEILAGLSEIDEILDRSETSILIQLSSISMIVSRLTRLSNSYQPYQDRIESALIDLKDLHQDLVAKSDQLHVDPEHLEQVKGQVDTYQRLIHKHKCLDAQELITLREQYRSELNLVDNRDSEIIKAKAALKQSEEELNSIGLKLSESRKKHAVNFAKEIEEIIHQIGIENGAIDIALDPGSFKPDGLDQVQFQFSANKGIKAKSLKEVASGGEFSRLIFAIKYLIASRTALPTIIFDEIDTGVSGEVAKKMIQFMKQMSQAHQVISISHLPQFAAGGDTHFYVYKDHSQDKSVTKIKTLENDERVAHIAQMISGNKPTDLAMDNARELLNN
jgi:DNA repair protein RecN (Recombination protein N)